MAHFIIDISGYNLYRYSAVAAGLLTTRTNRLANLARTVDPADPASTKFMREFSRVPIGTTSLARFFSVSAAGGLVYVPIDFKLMHDQDPRHPEAVYIKGAHGTAGPGAPDQYPTEDYIRPARDAINAGWGVGPYHYYYMDMDAAAQANAFYNSINSAAQVDEFGSMDPLVDLEDNVSTLYKSMLWDGVSDPTPKIRAIATFLGSTFKTYLETCDRLFSARLGRKILTRIYSGGWFWNPLIKTLLLDRSTQPIVDYYAPRMAYNAWYTVDHLPNIAGLVNMMGVDNQAVQFASKAIPPFIGLNVPGLDGVMGSSLDQGLYLKSDQEFYTMFARIPDPAQPGPVPVGTVGTFNQTVKIADRAFGVAIHTDDPRENMPQIAAATNFVFLDMAGNDGTIGQGAELYDAGDTFRIRADRAAAAGLPILGWVNLSAAYAAWRQYDLDPFRSRPYQNSEILERVIRTWRKLNTFDWAKLSAVDGNWHPLNGIVICMYQTATHTGSDIGGVWQVAVLDDLLKFLNTFMQGGYIPRVPIFVYSNPSFFKKYSLEAADSLSPYLLNKLNDKSIAGIGLGQPLYPQTPTAATLTLADVSKNYRFVDSYKYDFYPYKFDTAVSFFLYSWDRFLVPELMNRDGTPRTAAVAVWCDTPAEMAKVLGTPIVPPPPPPPPPPPDPVPVTGTVGYFIDQALNAALRDHPDEKSLIFDLEKLEAFVKLYLTG